MIHRTYLDEHDGGGASSGGDSDVGGGDGYGGEKPNTWPSNWREIGSKGDDGRLGRLSRYASPEAVFDAMFSAQNKISSGEYKLAEAFPADGRPEEQLSWRKNRGIPETHDQYDLKFNDDFSIPDDDKKNIDGFLKVAHAANLSPEQTSEAIRWHYDNQNAIEGNRNEADKDIARQTQDELRAEWGGDYRGNMNRIESMLTAHGSEELRENIINSRGTDGTPLFSDPDFLRFMANISLQVNPMTTLVPAGADQAKSIDGRLIEIKKEMSKGYDGPYYKGPGSKEIQKEYLDLLEAKERIKVKGS